MKLPLFLPIPIALKYLPDAFHSRLIARVFNHLMRGQDVVEDLSYLNGKTICLVVSDTGNSFSFLVTNNKLCVAPNQKECDVTIRGKLHDFLALATRSEDPDTLFFARRLCLEGDTDAGLYLKNTLDGLEYDLASHLHEVLGVTIGSRVYDFMVRYKADEILKSALLRFKPLP